ncbi:MAG: histidine kinase dimerization/phospho-acceptor domain-containing protein [Rhodothermus sp.]|nr:histidine kinase dimerization/phospho-acceptor domain-containing protein [Rhodothermus sp.]
MCAAEASDTILLVTDTTAPSSIVHLLTKAGWKVQTCLPEEMARQLAHEHVRGVIVRVHPDREAACLQTLGAAPARPVLLLTESEGGRQAVAAAQAGWLTAAAPDQIAQVEAWVQRLTAAGATSTAAQLRHLRQALSRLNHDLKNPLAIISGNAQFLQELLRMRGGDPELEGPVADIEEACRQIYTLLQRLVALRDSLPA